MTDKTFAVILERWLAGDSIKDLAEDYVYCEDEIEQTLRDYFNDNK